MRRKELGLKQHETRVLAIEQEFGEPLYDVIVGMRDQRCSWATIASVLEVTEQTLQKWREQLGISINSQEKMYESPKGVRSQADSIAHKHGYDTIEDLMYDWRVLKGMIKEDVAKMLGISVRTVYEWSPESANGHYEATEKRRVASSQNAKIATQYSPWRKDW